MRPADRERMVKKPDVSTMQHTDTTRQMGIRSYIPFVLYSLLMSISLTLPEASFLRLLRLLVQKGVLISSSTVDSS